MPIGLYCGWGDSGRSKNIFRRCGFKYRSCNDKYSERLPPFGSGDIVVLCYNSDLGQLAFQLFKKKKKSNDSNCNENEDTSSLNSYIYNLPRDWTFYWFFGHSFKPMSITLLD